MFACRRMSIVAMLLLVSPAMAADDRPWPQWRGPNRDDISAERGLLQSWPAVGPPRIWLNQDCGLGYGGPAIVGDRLFILGTRDDQEQLLCVSATSGDEIWSLPVGPIYENSWGNGPRSTPTVDGNFVYAQAAAGNLACVNATTGKLVWDKAMQDLGGEIPNWGYAGSPIIVGDNVLCTPGGEQGTIAALDKTSGDLRWQSDEITDGAHYSSIITMEQQGKTVAVQFLEQQLVGVDTADGKLLWSTSWPGRTAVCPTPIVRGNEVYVSAGYGAGCMLVRIGEDFAVEKAYDNKVMANHHGGVIMLDGHLYGHSNRKGWTCQKFDTGEEVWRDRDVLGKGAIAYADGRFYCLSEEEGDVVLIAASSEGWQEHGRFTLDPQTELRKPRGRIWVHPVIADGRLFLRDQELLFSFDVRAQLLSDDATPNRQQ